MVKTMVLPTDEELSIALQSCDATSIIAPAPKKLPARTLPSSMSDATVEELGLRHPSDAGVLKPSALPNRPAAAVDGGAGAVAGLGRAVMIESDSDTTLVEAALMSSLLPRARFPPCREMRDSADETRGALGRKRHTQRVHVLYQVSG